MNATADINVPNSLPTFTSPPSAKRIAIETHRTHHNTPISPTDTVFPNFELNDRMVAAFCSGRRKESAAAKERFDTGVTSAELAVGEAGLQCVA